MNKFLKLIPWGISKLYVLSMYMLAAYMLIGCSYALLIDLSVTTLNVVFGLGLFVVAFLSVPAVMSSDSGPSLASNLFIGTIFSYPFVYLVSLIISRWVPVVADNEGVALYVAALPLINVFIFIGLIVVLIIKEKK